jgi:hypothetical protein
VRQASDSVLALDDTGFAGAALRDGFRRFSPEFQREQCRLYVIIIA